MVSLVFSGMERVIDTILFTCFNVIMSDYLNLSVEPLIISFLEILYLFSTLMSKTVVFEHAQKSQL